jgi:formylglycine-generating enzyme required for sulfatase activity
MMKYRTIAFAIASAVASAVAPCLLPGLRAQHRPTQPIARAPQLGDVKVNPTDGQRYVWIPAGKFTMGCSLGDDECSDNEKPSHEVTLTKGFWLAQTTVTVGAWKRYRTATGARALPTGDSMGRKNLNEGSADDDMTAVAATWDEAKSYCEWSGGRLPTEAEWEFAARAGNPTSRYGDLDAIAWLADNSGKQRINSTELWRNDRANYDQRLFENGNGPHPVKRKQPNAWKLYDMLGNVWQWTADWYDKKYYERNDNRDPAGPASGTQRAQRGGSWLVSPRTARVSSRGWSEPDVRDHDVGVRCAGR